MEGCVELCTASVCGCCELGEACLFVKVNANVVSVCTCVGSMRMFGPQDVNGSVRPVLNKL